MYESLLKCGTSCLMLTVRANTLHHCDVPLLLVDWVGGPPEFLSEGDDTVKENMIIYSRIMYFICKSC